MKYKCIETIISKNKKTPSFFQGNIYNFEIKKRQRKSICRARTLKLSVVVFSDQLEENQMKIKNKQFLSYFERCFVKMEETKDES